MFTAIVLSPDIEAAKGLQLLADESGQVSIQKAITQMSQSYELVRALNSYDPDLVFLDIGDWNLAVQVGAQIRSVRPQTAIVGFGGGWVNRQESSYKEASISALLVSPVDLTKFQEGVNQAIHIAFQEAQEKLYAFLPAKAGSGCTSTVLNIAGCLSGELNLKVLLIESDLRSGVLAELAQCSPSLYIQDALANQSSLNRSEWSKFIVHKLGIDFLLTDRNRPRPLPEWTDYFNLLRFVALEYDLVLVDMPELVNPATAEIVGRAKEVFVICTAELSSLELARQRLDELANDGVPSNRIHILLNRWLNSDLAKKDVVQFLNRSVAGILPNDYVNLRKASMNGDLIPQTTPLGKSYLALATRLAGVENPAPPSVFKKTKLGLVSLLSR